MSKLIDPKMGSHNPTIISVLATSVCTAGIPGAPCGVVVDIVIVRAQGMSQPAVIAICKTGNHRT